MGSYASRDEDGGQATPPRNGDGLNDFIRPPSNIRYRVVSKVMVIGDSGVGKTQLLKQFVGDREAVLSPRTPRTTSSPATSPIKSPRPTIGVDHYSTSLVLYDSVDVEFQFWDMSGREKESSMRRVYYQDSIAAIVLFDLYNRETFLNASFWIQDIRTYLLKNDLPVLLIGTKLDLEDEGNERQERQVSLEEAQKLAQGHKCFLYLETSAKTGRNCPQILEVLGEEILASHNTDTT